MEPPQVYRLEIAHLFNDLSEQEKLYSHYMARAAWSGTRIILRQVSPESPAIFDFILALYRSCDGDWSSVVGQGGVVTEQDMAGFLEYAATFLSNVGNYYGSGDQKFVPRLSRGALEALAARSPRLNSPYAEFKDAIFAVPPFSLGFPGERAQSSYYPGELMVTKDDLEYVSACMDAQKIYPENTRLRKTKDGTLEILQGSALQGETSLPPGSSASSAPSVKLLQGDHAAELQTICENLQNAAGYAANDTQRKFLAEYIESFRTGDLEAYRDAQRTWISDQAPKVENISGFVEPYRDPYGVRAEFEGLVAIADPFETKLLTRLVENSDQFIRRLPWAGAENNGKGAFEKTLFEPPDFASIHSLAYCSSIIFPGINLPNYNDIRQDVGFKNVIIANRMAVESTAVQWPFIDPDELPAFKKHKHSAYYWWVVLHELLGHGTGRMMVEQSPGQYNFDVANPPLSPLTGEPIRSWYSPGQTWTGQFGDLATTVDECRAELVGAYLMDDKELLVLFGFTETTEIRASDVTYNLYQQLGVDGLRGLANFNVDSMKWGQSHSRAHFAMLKCLLTEGGGCVVVQHDSENKTLRVKVDKTKILSHGKPALGQMLLRLHMYRCTADVQACREYYEGLSRVDGEYLSWRETVLANKPPAMLNVQANTFLKDGQVVLKQYAASVQGIIESWVDRNV
ncbi:dipeptidyl-peptidase 3 [Apiospora marii]|uniref:dipeptidyl-peptidase 3 n=1 Tax=Apiospora marii TaxID=335849 RepID=UPI00312DE915